LICAKGFPATPLRFGTEPERSTEPLAHPERLRELACWYRGLAERTANPTIWDARLRTAEDLEAEAVRLERTAPLSEVRAGD
jgi:hypothetical protein